MKKVVFLLIFSVLTAVFSSVAAQTDEKLEANKEKKFAMAKLDEKVFALDLKKGDFADVYWQEKGSNSLNFMVKSPSGVEVTKGGDFMDSFPFVAAENGTYKVYFKPDQYSEGVAQWNMTVGYKNAFALPKTAKLQRQRKINGYNLKIYNSNDESDSGDYGTYLVIEKAGKIKAVRMGGSLVSGGFNFADDATLWDYPEGKKSSALFRTTPDKTGEGTPDVAIQYYTGGAHCCYKMYVYELGADEVTALPVISGDDSDIIAVRKKTTGGLAIQTGDSNFAYWLTSFAGSPIPTVILSYKNGEFRPDISLMKKPAPTLVALKAKVAKAKKNITLKAYTGEENEDFLYAFWDEMIDLMYSGNEKSAWQYFDLVWDSRKPGKEKFKEDFINKLNNSPYWQQMQADKK